MNYGCVITRMYTPYLGNLQESVTSWAINYLTTTWDANLVESANISLIPGERHALHVRIFVQILIKISYEIAVVRTEDLIHQFTLQG